MTVTSTAARVDYTGTASSTYAYPFYILASTDLEVYISGALASLTVDYTVTGVGTSTGGNVVFVNSVSGLSITILRNAQLTQQTDYTPNDSFPAESTETALDRLTMIAQWLKEAARRTFKFAPTSSQQESPIADLVAGKFLQVNGAANGIVMADVTSSGSIGIPVSIAQGGTGATANPTAVNNLLTTSDSRTNTVVVTDTHYGSTSGTAAAGIGAGAKFQAKSADETPSDFGQIQFAASDVTAASEDTFFEVMLRVAGAALAVAYRFVSTTAFRSIFTHANTADRTYTLPDESGTFIEKIGGVDLTGQNAAIGSTLLYSVPSTGAGQYRVLWNAKVTTVAGTGSTLGPVTITYTDPDGVGQTVITPAYDNHSGTIASSDTGNDTLTLLCGLSLLLNCKASTNINYSIGYASNASGVMHYNLHIRIEKL